MSDVQYINGFRAYADTLARTYSTEFSKQELYPRSKKVWQLEKAMHRMENELNLKLTQILEEAEEDVNTPGTENLELRLANILKGAIQEWMIKNIELLNKETGIEKATVLR